VRRIVHLEPDPVAQAVGHVQEGLRAADRLLAALVGPRRIEGGVHALREPEPGDAARQPLPGNVTTRLDARVRVGAMPTVASAAIAAATSHARRSMRGAT
jgi:hypothetical protein